MHCQQLFVDTELKLPYLPSMPKETQIQLRLSYRDKKALEAQANRERLPLATWIRQLALKAAATPEERNRG